MFREMRRGSTDGNGKQQQSFFIASVPKKNPARGSNAANFERVQGNRRGESNQNWNNHPKAPKSQYLRKPSYQEEHEYTKIARSRSPEGEQHYVPKMKDEASSTASSDGQQKSTETLIARPIEDFKVVIRGDVFDGVKHNGKHHNKFAAATLCSAPEPNQLQMPEL